MSRRGSALVALAGFVVYASLCPPVSGMGDSSEFTLVLATNGVAHPTGYPLYTLLGHLFGSLLHALGVTWPKAAALWSAVGGAVALYFLHALGTELAAAAPGVRPVTAFLAALIPLSLFAFQPMVLGEATNAEINVWSLAWSCGAAYLFVRIAGALRERAAEASWAARAAALWGLACGVGLAHHLTSIFVSVPLSLGLLVMLARRRRLTPSLPLIGCAAALLPLSSYGIIAWHAWHPAQVQWARLEPSVTSVIQHVTGAPYRHFFGRFVPNAFQQDLLAHVGYPFLFPGLILLVLGMARARDLEGRIIWASLFSAALLAALFTFRYGVPDPAPYFLPAMALGVAAAAPAIASIPGAGSRAGAVAIAAAGLAGLFLIVPWLEDGREEWTATLSFERVIRSMWSAIPPDTAIVSWADDRFNRLVEYQILRGEKPALLIITPDLLFSGSMRRAVIRRFGVDPMTEFHPPPHIALGAPGTDSILERNRQRLVEDLNRRVRVPVILFDPTRPIVFQLRKPWEPAQDSTARSLPPPRHWAHPPIEPRR